MTLDGIRPGSSDYRRLNAAMLCAGIAAFGMLYSTQALLPQLGAAFDVPATSAALTVSVSTGAIAVTVLILAWSAERVGRVRTMRAGLTAAVVAQFVVTVAPSFPVLIGARGVQGVALACFLGVAMGHVGRAVHPAGLGRAMGLYVAGNALGGVAGRLVTAGLADLAGWRVAVAAFGVIAAAGVVAFAVLLPRSQREAPSSAVSGSGARRGGHAGWRNLELWVLAAVPFVLMGGFVAIYNYLTYRLADPPFEVSTLAIGLIFTAYLAGVVSSAGAGWMVDRAGRSRVLGVCLMLMALGVLLTLPDRLVWVLAGLLVLTAGFFGAHAVASGWVPVVARGLGPPASGLYVTAYYAGSSVIGVAAGYAWIAGGWPALVWAVLFLIAVAASCCVVVARRTSRG